MLTTTQYECASCDAIDLAVKCDEHGEPVKSEDDEYHHLRCKHCDERIVHLDQDLDDDFGFDDDAGNWTDEKKLVIYRGDERIQGTPEELADILGCRLYVFTRFLRTGKAYNNPRFKGVRVTTEKPTEPKSGMAKLVKAMSTPGTPENEAVRIRAPRENISKKVDNKQRLFCFEKDGIYLNARQNYALCIASDHKKREYRFVAIYNTPTGYKLASANNEGAVTTTNEDGMSPNGYKVMYNIDINAMSAEDLKEFIAMRNFVRGKLGLEPEVFVAVESKIVEVVKDPGLLDRAVLEDRLKNLETVVEQLRGKAQ